MIVHFYYYYSQGSPYQTGASCCVLNDSLASWDLVESAYIPYPSAFRKLLPPSFNFNGAEGSYSIPAPDALKEPAIKGRVKGHTQRQWNANIFILLSAKHPEKQFHAHMGFPKVGPGQVVMRRGSAPLPTHLS